MLEGMQAMAALANPNSHLSWLSSSASPPQLPRNSPRIVCQTCHAPHLHIKHYPVHDSELQWKECTVSNLHGEPTSENAPPSLVALISALKHYGKTKALLDGKHVHAQVSKDGYDRHPFVGNCLIQMYGNCGSMEEAQAAFDIMDNPNVNSWNILMNAYAQNGRLDKVSMVFEKMPERDVVSWNVMIGACARNGQAKKGLELFHQMQPQGIKHDKITFICVLDACGSLGALEEGQEVFAVSVNNGCEHDLIVGNALINMYCKCRSLEDARRVFDRMPQHNVVSWTTMIAGCSRSGHCKEALRLLCQMQHGGILPNKVTFLCVLDACTTLAVLEDIHAAVTYRGYEPDVIISTALISTYGKCGDVDAARITFARMTQRNVVSWNSMISACSLNGRCNEALKLFHQMTFECVKPNKITFLGVLEVCSSLSHFREGQRIHAIIVDSEHEGDDVVGTALVNMYGKCRRLDCARSVFDKMMQHDVISWSSMISAYAQDEHNKEALELFHQMQFEGVKPDKITFVCILNACASLAALEEGGEIHAAIVDSGYNSDIVVGTALINMYGKCGKVCVAKSVLARLPVHDRVSWSALITACAQNGQAKEALELFQQMQSDGVRPDGITFTSILTACSHTGQVNDGRCYFVSMRTDHDLTHTVEHYACMVDLLGRAGHLDEAENLIKNMLSKRDAVAWLSLLSACKLHGDVARGERAATHCFQLDPKNVVPYVMLSNIYATAGRWGDVMKVQETMKNNGVKKRIGRSYIEVNKRVYEFNGELLHPQKVEIHAELERLIRLVENSGYMPDIKRLLQDEETAAEGHNHYHSEMQAIAFGLIATIHGTPLHIAKDFQMCFDCHATTKLISSIVMRKIIVNDGSCCHHFEHGSCSCGDIW